MIEVRTVNLTHASYGNNIKGEWYATNKRNYYTKWCSTLSEARELAEIWNKQESDKQAQKLKEAEDLLTKFD